MPIWNNRISPLFDSASRLMIATIEDNVLVEITTIDISDLAIHKRVQVLIDEGIEVLICGGISNIVSEMLTVKKLTLIQGVKGSCRIILMAFLENRLDDPDFSMPGCRSRRRHGQYPQKGGSRENDRRG